MLLQRRRARQRVTDFARYVSIPGVPVDADVTDDNYDIVETPLAKHHILILDTCQSLVDNTLCYNPDTLEHDDSGVACKRVMFALPPGSAKSTFASVVFPVWQMGRNPFYEIILTGYGETIVKRHGKRARQICASKSYRSVFNINVDPHTRAADSWAMVNGSSYKAAGILSGITGFRCDLLIWDDLVKGRKEADSAVIQQDTWNAYMDDARTRKKPDAHEIGIGTRWNEQDLQGQILPDGYAGETGFIDCDDGNVWYVVSIAAQCERDDDILGREIGEYIWPDWFDASYWVDKKVNPRSWASLYQQRPSLEEGLYFNVDWFRTYTDLPKSLNRYISFDPAVSDAESADDTAIQVWGIDTAARIYLIDEWVAKTTMDIWIAHLITLISIHKPLEVISESGVIRRAAEPYILREMQRKGVFAVFEWVSRHADKAAMARPAQAMTAAGQVYFPATSVGDNTRDELLRFPAGRDDHRVDAFANLCLRLEDIWSATPPAPEKKPAGVLNHDMTINDLIKRKKRKSRWG